MKSRVLWLAVIRQALDDYYTPTTDPQKLAQNVDREYFYSPDFAEICNRASVDPVRVLRANRI